LLMKWKMLLLKMGDRRFSVISKSQLSLIICRFVWGDTFGFVPNVNVLAVTADTIPPCPSYLARATSYLMQMKCLIILSVYFLILTPQVYADDFCLSLDQELALMNSPYVRADVGSTKYLNEIKQVEERLQAARLDSNIDSQQEIVKDLVQ